MFKNPDFKGLPNILMFLAMVSLYDLVYAYSSVLGVSWVDISSDVSAPYLPPSETDGVISTIMLLIFFIPALYIPIKRGRERISNNEITIKNAVKVYFKTLAEFMGVFVLLVIFLPIIVPYLRGWK